MGRVGPKGSGGVEAVSCPVSEPPSAPSVGCADSSPMKGEQNFHLPLNSGFRLATKASMPSF